MMPSILTRYLAWQILKVTAFVLVIMLGLYLFVSFISELNNIGHGHYGAWDAVKYVVCMLPLNLYQIFPMMSLLGCLIGLGVLASHNEITVMRAATMSVAHITRVVLAVAVLMIVLAVVVGEVAGPSLANYAENKKAVAENSGKPLQDNEGMWLRSSNHFIYVESILPGKQLQNVTDFYFNAHHQLESASFAKQAVHRNGVWYLENVVTSHLQENQVVSSESAELVWPVTINPELVGFFVLNAQEVSLTQLHHFIQIEKQNGLSPQQYDFTFWQRVFQPLAILVMIVLAIPFIFGPLRSSTMGFKILTGIVIGFTFFLLNRFLGPVSLVFQLSPIIAALLPIIIFGTLGLVLLKRTR